MYSWQVNQSQCIWWPTCELWSHISPAQSSILQRSRLQDSRKLHKSRGADWIVAVGQHSQKSPDQVPWKIKGTDSPSLVKGVYGTLWWFRAISCYFPCSVTRSLYLANEERLNTHESTATENPPFDLSARAIVDASFRWKASSFLVSEGRIHARSKLLFEV